MLFIPPLSKEKISGSFGIEIMELSFRRFMITASMPAKQKLFICDCPIKKWRILLKKDLKIFLQKEKPKLMNFIRQFFLQIFLKTEKKFSGKHLQDCFGASNTIIMMLKNG